MKTILSELKWNFSHCQQTSIYKYEAQTPFISDVCCYSRENLTACTIFCFFNYISKVSLEMLIFCCCQHLHQNDRKPNNASVHLSVLCHPISALITKSIHSHWRWVSSKWVTESTFFFSFFLPVIFCLDAFLWRYNEGSDCKLRDGETRGAIWPASSARWSRNNTNTVISERAVSQHPGPDWSNNCDWIALKYGTDVHVPLGMNCNQFA